MQEHLLGANNKLLGANNKEKKLLQERSSSVNKYSAPAHRLYTAIIPEKGWYFRGIFYVMKIFKSIKSSC